LLAEENRKVFRTGVITSVKQNSGVLGVVKTYGSGATAGSSASNVGCFKSKSGK
jgi:hypothetical protein